MMMKFDDLRERLTDKPIRETEPQIVLALSDSLEAEWNSDAVAHGLWEYFSEDEARSAVRLSISGRFVGYLNRESFVESGTRMKLGEAQSATVPGESTNYRFIQLKCPVAECSAPFVLKAYYDPRSPPVCPLHPDTTLEVA